MSPAIFQAKNYKPEIIGSSPRQEVLFDWNQDYKNRRGYVATSYSQCLAENV
jgi:hypothetical protein